MIFQKKNIKKITDEVKAITDMVNQYYKAFLAFKWRKNIGRSFLKDRADRMRFMDTEANSIGCYIEDGNPGSYLVERSISTINGIYKAELEDDIKKYYNAEYDYEGDRDLLILDSLVLLANKDITVAEKKEHISDEECKTIKDGEEDKRVTAGTKNIMADAPTLFTYIHWEVMKSNDK